LPQKKASAIGAIGSFDQKERRSTRLDNWDIGFRDGTAGTRVDENMERMAYEYTNLRCKSIFVGMEDLGGRSSAGCC